MQSIKVKTPAPVKPDEYQERILSKHFVMEEAWFRAIFEPGSRLVERPVILGEWVGTGKKRTYETYFAQVWARDAVIGKGTKQETPTVYCFFIFYRCSVYMADTTTQVGHLIEALKTDEEWDRYQDKLADAAWKKEQKLKRMKKAARVKSITKKRKAA